MFSGAFAELPSGVVIASHPAPEWEGEARVGSRLGMAGSGLFGPFTGPATGRLSPGPRGKNSVQISFWHLVKEGFVTS